MRIPRSGYVFFGILILFTLGASGSMAFQESEQASTQELFLADGAGPEEYLTLLNEPDLIRERPVQAKLLRGLRDTNLEIFKATAAVVMMVPEIDFIAPRLWRRLETTFLGGDDHQKQALLELALGRQEYREDLRVVGLVAEALLEKDSQLAATALSLADQSPEISSNPAVAEALSTVQERKSSIVLPDFEEFRREIEPVLTRPGADATFCVECHKNRTILRLQPAEEIEDEGDRVRQHYRALLRVVDLQSPESSLLLRKPTRPAPQTQPAPASLETHTGGARFQVGDETYQKIVAWIRSGH